MILNRRELQLLQNIIEDYDPEALELIIEGDNNGIGSNLYAQFLHKQPNGKYKEYLKIVISDESNW